MTFSDKSTRDGAEEQARQAIERGAHVLVYKFIDPITDSFVTAPMLGISPQIEAVEALGWQLDRFSAVEGKVGDGEHIAVICLFRR
ncbi:MULTISPECIES: hypothetical protein [Streptomyces]|uniref:Uncharacterized protein n=1 Tax=Streptomyces xanthii TaxID=2768069 RepID=A0A7H1BG31_9ACTN|nr:hypothetical protein [Streptomyces xanthii]QNS07686.1 hypothetical protein IAG42_31500 [Streptomyces xanthii]